MRKYKNYCTSEQTRKALELGAPIFTFSESFADDYRTSIYDKYCSIPPIKEEGYEDDVYADIPTTDEMIGWLEEQNILIEIYYNSTYRHYNYCKKYGGRGNWGGALYDSYTKGFSSRKEATLAAIDAALEYLGNKKST